MPRVKLQNNSQITRLDLTFIIHLSAFGRLFLSVKISRRSLWLDDYSLFTANFIQTSFLLHSALLTRSCHELFSLHNSLSIVMNHTGIICNTHHVKAASVLLLLSKKCCRKRRSEEGEKLSQLEASESEQSSVFVSTTQA